LSEVLRTVELFAGEVMPVLRHLAHLCGSAPMPGLKIMRFQWLKYTALHHHINFPEIGRHPVAAMQR
jgi:hypothetical protein